MAHVCERRPGPVLRDLRATDAECSFRLEGATDALANALRRVLLRDLPTVAISRVRVFLNETPFPDDMLAHRLGLVPLRCTSTHLAQLAARGPLRADALDDEPPTFTLHRTGPCTVSSSDLVGAEGAPVPLADVGLCPLASDQTLTLHAWCELGRGDTHARFGVCAAPRFERRHRGVEARECFCVRTAHGTLCAICGNAKPSLLATRAPIDHLFTFETLGVRPARDVLVQALLILEGKLQALRRAAGCVQESSGLVAESAVDAMSTTTLRS